MEYLAIVVIAVAAVVFITYPLFGRQRKLHQLDDMFDFGDTKQLNFLNLKKSRIEENLRELDFEHEMGKLSEQDYSALRGFFRQFELYYVVADERDLITLRTNHRGERVELYRVRGSEKGPRALLLDYVREMDALAENPRRYNALTHNCTTTIWHHTKAVGVAHPFDWRLLAKGYLVDLA